jgi:hypothetical protein
MSKIYTPENDIKVPKKSVHLPKKSDTKCAPKKCQKTAKIRGPKKCQKSVKKGQFLVDKS